MNIKRFKSLPVFNRWLIPPAALAVHLCLGAAYGFSVFWLPLSQALGISKSLMCTDMNLMLALFTTKCDWRISDLGWIYTFFFIFIGLSATFSGRWLEEVGPRRAAMVSASFWSGGMIIAALGVFLHQLWILWLGAGVIGGIGLGIGYISPVSMLLKWFPDRPGMATGMALMGFGGGAIISAPAFDALMSFFKTSTDSGAYKTLLIMAIFYFMTMSLGAFGCRLPPEIEEEKSLGETVFSMTSDRSYIRKVCTDSQFWLIWLIFLLNSSAGLGMTGIASPMFQEIFEKTLSSSEMIFSGKVTLSEIAAGFMGFLFLFSITGRFFWPFISDYITRKTTCYIFFAATAVIYALLPSIAHAENQILFTLLFCILMSFYGGGIAIAPSYLSDVFGRKLIGEIHGKLLSASIFSGIIGPSLVNYMREFQIGRGIPAAESYNLSMYILALMMVAGFIANFFITPNYRKLIYSSEEVFKNNERKLPEQNKYQTARKGLDWRVVICWMGIGLPLLWGMSLALRNASLIFY